MTGARERNPAGDAGNHRVVWLDNAVAHYNSIAQFHGCVGQSALTASGSGALPTCLREPAD